MSWLLWNDLHAHRKVRVHLLFQGVRMLEQFIALQKFSGAHLSISHIQVRGKLHEEEANQKELKYNAQAASRNCLVSTFILIVQINVGSILVLASNKFDSAINGIEHIFDERLLLFHLLYFTSTFMHDLC